jgi:hypothetical protein
VEVVIANLSVVLEDVVSVYDFVKDVPFKPCLLHKVYIKLLEFHGRDEVFVSHVIMWRVGTNISIFITWTTTETMCILREEFADDEPLVAQRRRRSLAADHGSKLFLPRVPWWSEWRRP